MKLESVVKEKVLIVAMVLFLLISSVFYFVLIRPLATVLQEKETSKMMLDNEIASYEKLLQELEKQTMTEEEKNLFVEGIPGRPNIEQLIMYLGQVEKDTGTAISSISFLTDEAEEVEASAAPETTAEPTTESSETTDAAASAEATVVPNSAWSEVFPEEIYNVLQEKLSTVAQFDIQAIDIDVTVNGNEANINQFVAKLEDLPRVTHIQNLNYAVNQEKGNMDATVTFRIFYCEAFQPIIDQLNGTVAKKEESKEEAEAEPDPAETATVLVEVKRYDTDIVVDGSAVKVTSDFQPVEGEGQGFYLVQTGAYTADKYLALQVDRILATGINPRVSDSSISLIFSTISHSIASAAAKAQTINAMGFETYIMPLKINMSAEESTWLLPVAQSALASISQVTAKGEAEGSVSITAELENQVNQAVATYETEVTNRIAAVADGDGRKEQLKNTIAILKDIQTRLASYKQEAKAQKLWEIDGLLIDFTLNLNGNTVNNR